MRSLLAFITLSILVACNPSPEVSKGSSSNKSINQEAPFIWGNKTFPKSVHISSTFSNAELVNITNMGTAWKTAVSDKKNFFSFTTGNNNYNINSTDDIMGIYKVTDWPEEITDDALAITQLFGLRYNVGDVDEYVKIVEADILVNYKPGIYGFTFDTADSGDGFDLRTVILHEMGHFIGLQHIPDYDHVPNEESDLTREEYKATSVMYPSISSLEAKRVPMTKDINALVSKYNISMSLLASSIVTYDRYQPKNNDPGKNIKILIELMPNGECLHKENGAVIRRHHVKLK